MSTLLETLAQHPRAMALEHDEQAHEASASGAGTHKQQQPGMQGSTTPREQPGKVPRRGCARAFILGANCREITNGMVDYVVQE